jgi:hypothetical protein
MGTDGALKYMQLVEDRRVPQRSAPQECCTRRAERLRAPAGQDPRLRLAPRGPIEVKGKGVIETYWVLDPDAPYAGPPDPVPSPIASPTAAADANPAPPGTPGPSGSAAAWRSASAWSSSFGIRAASSAGSARARPAGRD